MSTTTETQPEVVQEVVQEVVGEQRVYSQRKQNYDATLRRLVREHTKVLVINVNNVRSVQLQQARKLLRGRATFIIGKNTMMRRILNDEAKKNPKLKKLCGLVNGNCGFVFVDESESLADIKKVISENKIASSAKVGSAAPCEVVIPAGPTDMDPAQTQFFQALNIQTKIARGKIEIIEDIELVKQGQVVTSNVVALLAKLDLKPFFYGIVVDMVYEDGEVYEAKILDLDHELCLQRFYLGVNAIAAISLELELPTQASITHSINGAFKKLLAIGFQTDYIFEEAKVFKDAADAKPVEASDDKVEEVKKEEEKADALSEGGLGMFGAAESSEEESSSDDDDEE